MQFWKCVHAGKVYNVFRPIDPLASPAAIPIIRAQIGGREVYPVSFVRYGFGLLSHIGLDLSQGRNAECRFARDAESFSTESTTFLFVAIDRAICAFEGTSIDRDRSHSVLLSTDRCQPRIFTTFTE